MARTAGGPHRQTGKVFALSDKGLGQKQIAAETGLSQPTVSRILKGPRPVIRAAADAPEDFRAVQVEFAALFDAAKQSNDVDGFRHVHRVARMCFENGYRVVYGCLPYIVALYSEMAREDTDTAAGRQRWAGWSKEVGSVYDFMKFYGLGNWAKREPQPVPETFWQDYLELIGSAQS